MVSFVADVDGLRRHIDLSLDAVARDGQTLEIGDKVRVNYIAKVAVSISQIDGYFGDKVRVNYIAKDESTL